MASNGKPVTTAVRLLAAATVILYVFMAGIFYWAYTDAVSQRDRLTVVATTTAQALCTFRRDLERRVETTSVFLKDNPKGVAGIPVSTLVVNLKNQEATLKSLDGLHCPPPKEN